MGYQSAGAISETVLLGIPNREPQENSRNILEYRTLVTIFLLCIFYSILGVPCLGFPLEPF